MSQVVKLLSVPLHILLNWRPLSIMWLIQFKGAHLELLWVKNPLIDKWLTVWLFRIIKMHWLLLKRSLLRFFRVVWCPLDLEVLNDLELWKKWLLVIYLFVLSRWVSRYSLWSEWKLYSMVGDLWALKNMCTSFSRSGKSSFFTWIKKLRIYFPRWKINFLHVILQQWHPLWKIIWGWKYSFFWKFLRYFSLQTKCITKNTWKFHSQYNRVFQCTENSSHTSWLCQFFWSTWHFSPFKIYIWCSH